MAGRANDLSPIVHLVEPVAGWEVRPIQGRGVNYGLAKRVTVPPGEYEILVRAVARDDDRDAPSLVRHDVFVLAGAGGSLFAVSGANAEVLSALGEPGRADMRDEHPARGKLTGAAPREGGARARV